LSTVCKVKNANDIWRAKDEKYVRGIVAWKCRDEQHLPKMRKMLLDTREQHLGSRRRVVGGFQSKGFECKKNAGSCSEACAESNEGASGDERYIRLSWIYVPRSMKKACLISRRVLGNSAADTKGVKQREEVTGGG
jgi:hypothetical protein